MLNVLGKPRTIAVQEVTGISELEKMQLASKAS